MSFCKGRKNRDRDRKKGKRKTQTSNDIHCKVTKNTE